MAASRQKVPGSSKSTLGAAATKQLPLKRAAAARNASRTPLECRWNAAGTPLAKRLGRTVSLTVEGRWDQGPEFRRNPLEKSDMSESCKIAKQIGPRKSDMSESFLVPPKSGPTSHLVPTSMRPLVYRKLSFAYSTNPIFFSARAFSARCFVIFFSF